MHTAQGDTWEIGADVTRAATAGWGESHREALLNRLKKTEGRRLGPIAVTPHLHLPWRIAVCCLMPLSDPNPVLMTAAPVSPF